jgi:hypothetical protein
LTRIQIENLVPFELEKEAKILCVFENLFNEMVIASGNLLKANIENTTKKRIPHLVRNDFWAR